MNIRNYISIETENLSEGESNRILCPACKGGRTEEKSLSITMKQGFALYNCYRDSCDLDPGRVNIGGILTDYIKDQSVSVNTKKLTKFRNWYNEGIFDDYASIGSSIMVLASTVYLQRLELLVTEIDNGFVAKRTGDKGYSILHNKKSDIVVNGPKTGILINNTSAQRTVIIVEDIVSAMWVYQCIKEPTFCLFGTELTGTMYEQIKSFHSFIWALDYDTNYGKQNYRKIRDKFPLKHHKFLVLPEGKDPKDLCKDELTEII